MLDWNSPIQYLKGVGPSKAAQLLKLGLGTVGQLLEFFPARYEDRSMLKSIRQLVVGECETFQAQVLAVTVKQVRRGLSILNVLVGDDTGAVELVWFNQNFLRKKFKIGLTVVVYGKVERQYNLKITNAEVEVIHEGDVFEGRILPVYHLGENVSQNMLRQLMKQVFALNIIIDEILPEEIVDKNKLMGRSEAFYHIHYPATQQLLEQAIERLKFEELFLLQVALLQIKSEKQRPFSGVKHGVDGDMSRQVLVELPFTLTAGQQAALKDIKADMEDSQPMQRLLQGDVGSGKTIIAALALIKTVENGYQGAFMAPTEILAEQHYHTLAQLFAPLGIKLGLLTGSKTKKQKAEICHLLRTGLIDILIGTHALIQEAVEFEHLGLVVTDEQHRFGVNQRARLQEKGQEPDVLFMTATPIPRTLALTVYGDLDVSLITHLPPGRKAIRTFLRGPEKRAAIYQFVRTQIEAGRQAYVVCPLVEESDKIDTQAAVQLFEELQAGYLKEIACGLIHGKLKATEKDAIMKAFYENELSLLVATTVIEVGVNVPNATMMVIEGAERFGLSQLHQLRGRIGRGSHQSYCVLIAHNKQSETLERLKVMTESNDGFVIAEKDLLLRGPGQFFGTRQHGLPDLKIANIVTDVAILLQARSAAQQLIHSQAVSHELQKTLLERFGPDFVILHN
ncbi:ATP-dependent DNA helicase RecG [Sporomusaceae bacterium BoRhaA]|uniref:ATP-dependent DNA helicase RecG n=1 Tax=Pelorhabdus rhamnosifermentans TaxID=2772457 RepID=UPI001C062F04|nr:ATP-dependent DNA helicase RecG [Pelorhabdus rhamnosifermentans]MBU2700340.1 ATP-dependent DNA helicase RecG [Pelorhabdus rhamnosifermentans]